MSQFPTAGTAGIRPKSSLIPLGWRLLTLSTFLVVLFHNTIWLFNSSLLGHHAYLGSTEFTSNGPTGVRVVPGGPLWKAGVRTGDELRLEPWTNQFRYFYAPGERVTFERRRAGKVVRGEVTAEPAPNTILDLSAELVLFHWLFTAVVLIGGFIAVRSQTSRSGLILGAGLTCLGLTGVYPSSTEAGAGALSFLVIGALGLIDQAPAVLLLAFAREQRRASRSGNETPVWRVIFWGGAALQFSFWLLPMVNVAQGGGVYGYLFFVSSAVRLSLFAVTLYVLTATWRESRGADQGRFAMTALAFALLIAGTQGFGTLINLTGNNWSFANPLFLLGSATCLSGAFLFAYAVLRHRVVDLGFAVNRTLVFGALSTLLLLVFGVAEWGVETLIPQQAREANVLVSAGIALGVFLSFHRLRDWIERSVERVFFRRWRENEATLRRFVRAAPHITEPDAMAKAAVAEFSRFAEGGEAAYYKTDLEGYLVEAGSITGLSPMLTANLTPLIYMRAEQRPLDQELPEGVALMLPLAFRNDLIGFFALGPKPTGAAYRPDEIELLFNAATQIGLDLHALRVEGLEAESRAWRLRAELLEGRFQRALAVGGLG